MKTLTHYLNSQYTHSGGQIWFEAACDYECSLADAASYRGKKKHNFTTNYSGITCEKCKEAVGMDALAECP